VIRTTSISERSGLFTRITMAFAIGTALGPAINFPLSKIPHHTFGPFQFSANSSPGYVMAALFALNALTFVFLFEEPHFVPEAHEDKKNRTAMEEWKAIFSKFGCVVLIATQFLVIFTQSSVELLVTPQTKLWYGFKPFENSLLFTGMTVVVVIAIIAVGFMVRWFQDRTLLMMGHSLVGVGTLIFVIFLVLTPNRITFYIEIWQFCVVCCLYVAAIAFYQTVLGSLFSKLLDDPPLEGRGQSVMSSSSAAGAIVGPIVSTVLLPHGILYVPAVVGLLWGFVLFMLLLAWHKMYVHVPIITELPEEEKGLLVGINEGVSTGEEVPAIALYTAVDPKK
jgi:MFS family permease